MKRSLKSILNGQTPKEDTLRTLLAEVEHIINSRPLTHVPVHPDDKEALTPNHFLIGGSSGWSLPGRYEQLELCSRKHWKVAQAMANQFWYRWISEYLPTKILRTKWLLDGEAIGVGDVVLVVNYQAPRNEWLKGIVQKTFPGLDERVRVALIKTKDREIVRPVVKLIKLATA